LAAIDSISFVTPKTVYKSDVTRLDETLLDYIIGSDSLTLKLKAGTPASLLPLVGDKLVLLDGCKALPYGFSGIVSEVRTLSDGIDVVCEQAYLEDLFDSFCSVSTTYGVAGSDTRYVASNGRPNLVVYNPDDRTFRLGPFSFDVTGEISQGIIPSGDLALKGGTSMSLSLQPTFRVHTFLMIGEGHGTYFSCNITGDIDIDASVSFYNGIEYSHEFLDTTFEIPIPYTAKLLNFYVTPGVFGRMSATVTSTFSISRKYILNMAYEFSSKGENVFEPALKCRPVSSSTNFEGSVDGSLAAGCFVEAGLNIVSRELAKVCVRGEIGWQLNGSYVLRNSDIAAAQKDTKLYERLKASSIETGPFVNLSLQSSVLNIGPSVSIGGSSTFAMRDIVPTFSNTKLTRGSNTSVDAHTEMSGNCAFPVIVGYKLFNDKKNVVADYDAPVEYTNIEGNLEHSFMEVARGNGYTVYPKVKLFGYDILASPPAKLAYARPKIVDFKVTDSEYSKGKFTNDGVLYDYRFDVALTAEIDNLDGVADWGYVYEDPNGKIKRISLMKYGTSYNDTRYTYYRNEAKSTVCLYTYVRYVGESEYTDDEPQYYPLEFAIVHPKIVDFKVTDSEYSIGKFTNDGMVYDYKFDVAVSAEIDNLDGVADWGYVYKGPNGNIKRISLMQYGKSYTDTRYAYYRNEAKSTACLYTYVRYEGDSDYMDDEPKYYPLEIAIQVHTCPDDNHPHAIDLGLPSGTKWSCSNVGASAPEEYGGYYSWGETSEKDVYSFDNYEFREGLDYINIGSEISDTQYDVACVRMGTPWRMPTEELQGELLQNCTKQWTQYNGVNGTLVTGPNGNNIFLPASGGRWGKNLKEAGERGTYRSGTLHSSHPYMVNGIFIDKDGCGWNGEGPETGYPVRAVCP